MNTIADVNTMATTGAIATTDAARRAVALLREYRQQSPGG